MDKSCSNAVIVMAFFPQFFETDLEEDSEEDEEYDPDNEKLVGLIVIII